MSLNIAYSIAMLSLPSINAITANKNDLIASKSDKGDPYKG